MVYIGTTLLEIFDPNIQNSPNDPKLIRFRKKKDYTDE